MKLYLRRAHMVEELVLIKRQFRYLFISLNPRASSLLEGRGAAAVAAMLLLPASCSHTLGLSDRGWTCVLWD